MMRALSLPALLLTLLATAGAARADCTALADAASGAVLVEEGDCATRITPASTFKIPLALMGYESGFLVDEHAPALPFKKGYVDWNPEWRQTTDPARWMEKSVVWYSQRITAHLGAARFARTVAAFDYGNADVSGDPGEDNGLMRSWIGSSLKISPREQLAFLGRMVRRELPVDAHAYDMTSALTALDPLPNGWSLNGKTGAAFPRLADGSWDREHGYGWFVGWAAKDGRTVVFVRQVQAERKGEVSAGIAARAAFIAALPGLLDKL